MTGERLGWFRLASHLHMSLQQCQNETTSSEFTEWMEYFDQDVNAFHREDYLLANVIAHLYILLTTTKKRIKLEDYLLKFKTKEPEKQIDKKEAADSFRKRMLVWAGIKRGK